MGKIPNDTKADLLFRRLEATKVVDRLLALLPSNYFTDTASTNFGIHYQSLAEEFANFYQSSHIVILDASLREAVFRMLYRNFGYMLDFYVKPFDSEAYREFLIQLVELYFLGSRTDNIADGAAYFSGYPVQAIEYVKLLRQLNADDYQSALCMPQKLLTNSDAGFCSLFILNDYRGISLADMRLRLEITNRDVFIFALHIMIDAAETMAQSPFQLVEDVRSFVRIIKPAHTLADIGTVFVEPDQFTIGDLPPYWKATLRKPEYWVRTMDLVLNPPPEIYEDYNRFEGTETLNSKRDGTWLLSSLMREEDLWFQTDQPRGEEQWTSMTDTFPLFVCREACQGYCESSCETANNCESFCEGRLQACYNCQIHCQNICQLSCELVCQTEVLSPNQDPGGVNSERCDTCQAQCESSHCESVCETVYEQVRCTHGCESQCQVLCEIHCETNCEITCQIWCQHCSQTGCQHTIMVPCFILAQDACYTEREGYDISKDAALSAWEHPMTDDYPMVVVKDACQFYCEEATCESVSCQAFCQDHRKQSCYHCQIRCQNTCQTFCEFANCETQREEFCEGGCQTTAERFGACASGCETTCQVLCELHCEVQCLHFCQSSPCQDTNCQGACQMFYEVVSHPPCNVGCQSSCQLSCQVHCQVDCMAVCQYLCERGCEAACLEGCQTSCQQGCQIACQHACELGCEFACMEACQVYCQTECMASCQQVNREDVPCQTCQADCEMGCQNQCEVICQLMCQIVKEINASSGRRICADSCQQFCQSACLSACQAACQVQCQNYDEVTPCAGCETACQDACEQLEQDCRLGCMLFCVTASEITKLVAATQVATIKFKGSVPSEFGFDTPSHLDSDE